MRDNTFFKGFVADFKILCNTYDLQCTPLSQPTLVQQRSYTVAVCVYMYMCMLAYIKIEISTKIITASFWPEEHSDESNHHAQHMTTSIQELSCQFRSLPCIDLCCRFWQWYSTQMWRHSSWSLSFHHPGNFAMQIYSGAVKWTPNPNRVKASRVLITTPCRNLGSMEDGVVK